MISEERVNQIVDTAFKYIEQKIYNENSHLETFESNKIKYSNIKLYNIKETAEKMSLGLLNVAMWFRYPSVVLKNNITIESKIEEEYHLYKYYYFINSVSEFGYFPTKFKIQTKHNTLFYEEFDFAKFINIITISQI